jgi:hypothetical protein
MSESLLPFTAALWCAAADQARVTAYNDTPCDAKYEGAKGRTLYHLSSSDDGGCTIDSALFILSLLVPGCCTLL